MENTLTQENYDRALQGVYATIESLRAVSIPPSDITKLHERAKIVQDEIRLHKDKVNQLSDEARNAHLTLSKLQISERIDELKNSLTSAKTSEGDMACQTQMEGVALRTASLALQTMEINAELMKAVINESMLVKQLKERVLRFERRCLWLLPIFILMNFVSVGYGIFSLTVADRRASTATETLKELKVAQVKQAAITDALVTLTAKLSDKPR